MFRVSTRSLLRYSIDMLFSGICNGDRHALAKAITLVESTNPDHIKEAGALLRRLRQHRHDTNARPNVRVAVSGSPGAGKSCFIEALGTYLVNTGMHVGVLAVDPSSAINGGSLLGDKTRMDHLSMSPKAYVRPSPSGGYLGGVTARCWETMELMDSAGFDVVLVETVGVGQSEVTASYNTDVFLLLVPPASGDVLQGAKKGIVEMADVIVVTKADGDTVKLARATRMEYKHASQMSARACFDPQQVLAVSSREERGMEEAWAAIDAIVQKRKDSGKFLEMRRHNTVDQLKDYINVELVRRVVSAAKRDGTMQGLERAVYEGTMTPREAGESLIAKALVQPSP